ncbi:TonB-dependent receptor [uncultured Algimonas sp.]|uniref:TonB-dependent receptor n=1 Tax=uncultured Algimonas sp. TaxID=1547920 RepID=UPI002607DDBE|nr:TonB-dependent receptor [uncultured Algimonas sp.]
MTTTTKLCLGVAALSLLPALATAQAPAETIYLDAGADEIIVTGTAQTYSSSDTTEEMALQQSPVTSVLSQIDSLPGVLVQEGDTFGFDDWSTGVALRGFQTNLGSQEIGITVDGMPNGGSNYGGGSKANRFIDTQNLDGIEVFQGTADIATRSNEALGGTLNFMTSDPLDDSRLRLSGTLGDFDAQRFYARYDTGLFLDDTTKLWVSLSSQTATDHVNQSAENRRDHIAAKLTSEVVGVNLTAYASFDDSHEDNYQRLFSAADFASNPNSDQLTAEWTGLPYVDQLYRKGWSTLRENFFTYLKADKEVVPGLLLQASVYRHDNDGRGDWVPPYIVDVTADGDGQPQSELTDRSVQGGAALGRIYFVNAAGVALSPRDGCVSSITFPYGGAGPEYDPACYPAGAIPVQSYRHTHYQKERTGFTADAEWEAEFGQFLNTLRGGIWYEDATRFEYRDWHRIIDTRVGFEFDEQAYWTQYNRVFPQTTFKWYIEDVVTFGDLTLRGGIKQFSNELERSDVFEPGRADRNFSIDVESDVLFSGGFTYAPSQIEGVELFGGYAENFKAIPDTVLEVINSAAGVPESETSENIEIGGRYDGERFNAALTWFDTNFDNRLFPAPTETVDGIDYLEASNGGFINGGGIESSGIEFAGGARLTDTLSLYTSFTYIDASVLGTGDATLDRAAGIFVGNRVPGIAETMGVVSLDYASDTIFAGFSTKFVGDRAVNLSNTWEADGYVDSDLYIGVNAGRISSELDALDLRLVVNNVFDNDWLAGISGNGAWVSAPRTVTFTATADF